MSKLIDLSVLLIKARDIESSHQIIISNSRVLKGYCLRYCMRSVVIAGNSISLKELMKLPGASVEATANNAELVIYAYKNSHYKCAKLLVTCPEFVRNRKDLLLKMKSLITKGSFEHMNRVLNQHLLKLLEKQERRAMVRGEIRAGELHKLRHKDESNFYEVMSKTISELEAGKADPREVARRFKVAEEVRRSRRRAWRNTYTYSWLNEPIYELDAPEEKASKRCEACELTSIAKSKVARKRLF